MGSSARRLALALLACAYAAHAHVGVDDEEGEIDGEGESVDYDSGPVDDEVARGPSSVFVMEHGLLLGAPTEWMPRGTLLLSGSPGGKGTSRFEARLSDAKEFVQLRPELQGMMARAVDTKQFYAIRMYSPEQPKRVLQASIPAKLLADSFEDWYDIFDVTVNAAGVPVSLSYRMRHTLGLSLFDHTQVQLSQPGRSEGPRVPPRHVAPGAKGGPVGPGEGQASEPQSISAMISAGAWQPLLRKYWWVILIVMLLLSSAGDDGKGKKK